MPPAGACIERKRERERERDSKCVAHSHTHTPKRPFTHTPRSPYKHTPWTYLALPKVHPVLLLRLDRVPLLHHRLLAAGPCSGTPPDILGPPFSPSRPIVSHPMVSRLFSPTYLYPPYPLARPVSAGQPNVAAGRLLFVDTATPVHQMVGRWICVCVSVCARSS